MALRLTATSLASSDTPGALSPSAGAAVPARTKPGAAFGAQLSADARNKLSLGDLAGYRALFGTAAEHDDPHARYHARLCLVEQGITAAGHTGSQARATQLFVAAATGALDGLDEEAREPVLLNYAAVALYELWSLDAARDLFQAAQRLDPALPHLERNLGEVQRRRREQGKRPLRPLHAAVPGLAARAKRVAAQAHPAQGLTLSLCMIVKDEEEMLPRSLAAAAPAVDEIVIVDTGSKDRTIEIAHQFGAKVIEVEWTGSFSDARNVSFEAATGDWIIYLDADEVLVTEDVGRLRALTGRVWREAFYFVETSYTGEEGAGSAFSMNALRIFRNRPHYRFEGRLHEQIVHHLPTYAAGRIEQTPIRVEHFGYLGAVREAKEKSRRNLELLRAQQAEDPESSFLHYNLGTEYALIGDHPAAVAEFERAWSLIEQNGEQYYDYVPTLLVRLVNALGSSGRVDEALRRASDALALFPGFTDLVYAQALASIAQGRDDDAGGYWEHCIEMGDAPARYGPTRGMGTYLPRISLAQLHAGRGEFDRAHELLEWCLAEHPDFIGVVGPYATVRLALGSDPDAVVADLESRVAKLSASARYVLAGVLYRHGAMPAAERQYRAVLATRPHSAQVRAELAEALLHQGRYADAAAEAAQIAGDDPYAPLAARIELWSRIASHDLDAARAALEKATDAGVPAAQLQVFEAWLELAADPAPEPRSLPVAALPLLGVILETFLGRHEFETFERLAGLLLRSPLPRREQREILASMYLKYGFLASAAQEWMAVCEAQPDGRSLVGLARVALAQGELEDAGVFATEALRHDSNNAAARDILARRSAPQEPIPAGL